MKYHQIIMAFACLGMHQAKTLNFNMGELLNSATSTAFSSLNQTITAIFKANTLTQIPATKNVVDAGFLELSNNETYKLIGLIGFCCVIILMIIYRYRKSIANDQRAYDSEVNISKVRLAALTEKQALLSDTFEKNSDKLNDLVNQLEIKKQLLTDIKQLVELAGIEQLINPETKSQFSRIMRNIQYSSHVDQEWHHFRTYFEKTSDQFLANLKEQFPTLSPNDYKLCVLYKTDSDHERIASIMEISIESARVMKHRLRKKLELPLNECLSEFLRKFDHQMENNQSQVA